MCTEPDKRIWGFLLELLDTLGPGSTSSDESDTGQHKSERNYHVKYQEWRHPDIAKYMDFIDLHGDSTAPVRGNQGWKKRLRGRKKLTEHAARSGLPLPLYNGAWLQGPSCQQKRTRESASKTPFELKKVYEVDQ